MHHLKVQRQQAATAIRSRRMVAAWSSRTAGWLGRRQRTAGCASWPRSTARRVIVTGSASPDDPELARYWADHRGRKHNGSLSVLMLARLKAQMGRCSLCRTPVSACRSRATAPARLGAVAAWSPDGDQQAQHRRRTGPDDRRSSLPPARPALREDATPASILAFSAPIGPA